MSDQTFDTSDGTDSEDKQVTIPRSQIKQLEKAAQGRKELQEQLDQANRRLAFAEAGLPLGDKRIGYFVKGYDGELTTDAILAAAEEAGFLQESQSPQVSGQTSVDQQIERSNIEAIQNASRGAQAPDPGNLEASLDAAFAEGGVDGMQAFLAQQGMPLAED